jgi:hypothetical protein
LPGAVGEELETMAARMEEIRAGVLFGGGEMREMRSGTRGVSWTPLR